MKNHNNENIKLAGMTSKRITHTAIVRSTRPEVFCKKGVLRNFTKFTGKHLRQSLFFNKVAHLRPATLLKRRLWQSWFPLNFVIFLRTPFYIEHLWWLLLHFVDTGWSAVKAIIQLLNFGRMIFPRTSSSNFLIDVKSKSNNITIHLE